MKKYGKQYKKQDYRIRKMDEKNRIKDLGRYTLKDLLKVLEKKYCKK